MNHFCAIQGGIQQSGTFRMISDNDSTEYWHIVIMFQLNEISLHNSREW